MTRVRRRAATLGWQVLIGVAALAIWQWGYRLRASVPWLVPGLLDPYCSARRSGGSRGP